MQERVQQTCDLNYFALAGAQHLHQPLACCSDQKKYLHVELLEEGKNLRFGWFLQGSARFQRDASALRPHLRGRCTRAAPRRHPRHRSAPLCCGNILCAHVRDVCGDRSARVGTPCLHRQCRSGACAVFVCGRPGRRCRRAAPLGDRPTKFECVTDSRSCFSWTSNNRTC